MRKRNAPPPDDWSEQEVAERFLQALAVQRQDLLNRIEFFAGRQDFEVEHEFYVAALSELDRETEGLREAAKKGEGWRAAWHAWQAGRWGVFYDVWALPAAERGRMQRVYLEKAGKARKGKHRADPADLRSDLEELHGRNGHLSWTRACEVVGSRHGLSGRQVRRIAPGTKW